MKGPRKFNMLVPAIHNGKPVVFQSTTDSNGPLKKAWLDKTPDAYCFVNNPPQWSEGELSRPRRLRARLLQPG